MREGGRNRFMRWTGIPVPFSPLKDDLLTSIKRAQAVFDSGADLAIAGEGAIHVHEGELLPLQEGAAYLALRAGVPIVPVAITGTSWPHFRGRSSSASVNRSQTRGPADARATSRRTRRMTWHALHAMVADDRNLPVPPAASGGGSPTCSTTGGRRPGDRRADPRPRARRRPSRCREPSPEPPSSRQAALAYSAAMTGDRPFAPIPRSTGSASRTSRTTRSTLGLGAHARRRHSAGDRQGRRPTSGRREAVPRPNSNECSLLVAAHLDPRPGRARQPDRADDQPLDARAGHPRARGHGQPRRA